MVRFLLKHYLLEHRRRVRWSVLNPLEAQEAVFRRLKSQLGDSSAAQTSGFARCRTLEDCRQLPVSDGDLLRPVFRAIFQSGGEFFGRSPIMGFARTSGTFAEPKDIPLTRAYLESLDRTLVRMVACQLSATEDWKTVLAGRQITIGSRPYVCHSPTGLPVCDISGLIPTRTWKSLRRFYIPNHRNLWIENWEEKIDLIIREAHGKDVHTVSGIPALVSDFARRACETHKVENLSQLWPNLRHFIYGGGQLSREQRADFTRRWFRPGHRLHFTETYFATEGALGFSYDPGHDGLALNSLENLYLFRDEDGGVFFAHEIQAGKRYSIYITTPGGLINYRMYDRVLVVSERPLLIQVVGREKEEISLTGERVSVEQIDLALRAAGITEEIYGQHLPVVWVEKEEKPRFVWGISDAACTPQAEWARRLDDELARLNPLFAEALLRERVIGPSKIVSISHRLFENRLRESLGRAQYKQRRVFDSYTEFVSVFGTGEG